MIQLTDHMKLKKEDQSVDASILLRSGEKYSLKVERGLGRKGGVGQEKTGGRIRCGKSWGRCTEVQEVGKRVSIKDGKLGLANRESQMQGKQDGPSTK